MLPTVLAKNIALGFFRDNFFILLCWKMIGGKKKRVCIFVKQKKQCHLVACLTLERHWMIYRTTTGSLHLRHTKIFFLCLMLTNLFKNSVFLLLVSSSRFSPITTTKFLASNIIIIIIIVIFSCDRTKPYELAFHITASVSYFTRLVSNKTYIRTCSLRVNRRPKCPWSDCILCIPLILGSSPNKGGYIRAVKQ